MSIKPPFTDVEVPRAQSGFYEGNSIPIALLSKGIMVALVLWALIWPGNAGSVLGSLNWQLLEDFNGFYIVIVGLFSFFLLVFVFPRFDTDDAKDADAAASGASCGASICFSSHCAVAT